MGTAPTPIKLTTSITRCHYYAKKTYYKHHVIIQVSDSDNLRQKITAKILSATKEVLSATKTNDKMAETVDLAHKLLGLHRI